jgi:hypothetical protein
MNFYLFFYYSLVLEKENFIEHKVFRQVIINKYFDISRSSRVKKEKLHLYTRNTHGCSPYN